MFVWHIRPSIIVAITFPMVVIPHPRQSTTDWRRRDDPRSFNKIIIHSVEHWNTSINQWFTCTIWWNKCGTTVEQIGPEFYNHQYAVNGNNQISCAGNDKLRNAPNHAVILKFGSAHPRICSPVRPQCVCILTFSQSVRERMYAFICFHVFSNCTALNWMP